MAKKVEIVLNNAGIMALMKGTEMQALLASQAQRISGGSGNIEVYVAGTRAVAEAGGNNEGNALLKAMKK